MRATMLDDGGKVPSDLPLQTSWTFYAHTDSTDYTLGCVALANVSSICEFWGAYDHIPVGAMLHCRLLLDGRQVHGISMFRASCRPEWEDRQNLRGGSYSYRQLGSVNDTTTWRELCMAAVGELLPCNGIRIVCKAASDMRTTKFEVWTSTQERSVPSLLAELTLLPEEACRFHYHSDRGQRAQADHRPRRDRRRK